jgi:hypothetical protein
MKQTKFNLLMNCFCVSFILAIVALGISVFQGQYWALLALPLIICSPIVLIQLIRFGDKS